MSGKFILTLALIFLAWLAFTGSLLFEEVLAGVLVSLIITILVYKNFIKGSTTSKLNPRRWIYFIAFLLDLIVREIEAHLRVISLIFTYRIHPEIVSIKSKMKSEAGLTALANSITMTPGTLTVNIKGSELLVHRIVHMPKEKILSKSDDFLEGVVK